MWGASGGHGEMGSSRGVQGLRWDLSGTFEGHPALCQLHRSVLFAWVRCLNPAHAGGWNGLFGDLGQLFAGYMCFLNAEQALVNWTR